MKKPETVIEESVADWAEFKGIISRKLNWEGRNGAPDRIFFHNGKILMIEFKKPKGKVKKHQAIEIAELAERGIEVPVIDNLPDAVRYLRRFFCL